MSEANKTRLEVQKILKDTITAGITALGGTGWTVMEFSNASFQSGDKIVLMNLVRSVKCGWQRFTYPVESNQLKRRDEWIDEQVWQLHFICKRKAGADGAMAEDMASNLSTWFNGAGSLMFRKSGIAPLRVESDSVIVYNDNSELYQKRAVFTVKLQVPKEMQTAETEMDALLPKVKPV